MVFCKFDSLECAYHLPQFATGEFCGILLLAATGICVTGDMVTSKLIEESKWPYWYLVCELPLIGQTFLCVFSH